MPIAPQAWGEQRIGVSDDGHCCSPVQKVLETYKTFLEMLPDHSTCGVSPDSYTSRGRRIDQVDAIAQCVDAVGDIAVALAWAADGQVVWAVLAFVCIFVNGCFQSSLLRRDEDRWPLYKVLPVGIFGLAPVDLLRRALSEDTPSIYTQGIKPYRLAELFCEQLPLALLQMYVGLSYGQLDYGSEKFNVVLFANTWMSVLQVIKSSASVETLYRPYISMTSFYGLTTLLYRAGFVSVMTVHVATDTCLVKGWAILTFVMFGSAFLGMVLEATNRDFTEYEYEHGRATLGGYVRLRRVLKAGKDVGYHSERSNACLRSATTFWQILWPAVCLFLVPGLSEGLFDAQPNNYNNITLPPGGPGTPQYRDCRGQGAGLFSEIAVYAGYSTFFCMLAHGFLCPTVGVITNDASNDVERCSWFDSLFVGTAPSGPKWSAGKLSSKGLLMAFAIWFVFGAFLPWTLGTTHSLCARGYNH
eukprot:COSAG04_NODE_2125_length_4740_cov_2.259858_3_plen_471_part_01